MHSPNAMTIVVDDNILMEGQISTAGAKVLMNFVPPFNAAVIDKLKNTGTPGAGQQAPLDVGAEQGADAGQDAPLNVTLKQSMPSEFGANLASSFGCVFAVADGEAHAGLGCDVNGAIRSRAVEKGLCFLRPTYGTVSRFGLVSTAPSMEQIGVVCGQAAECFDILARIAGFDERDGALAEHRHYAYTTQAEDIRGLRFALPDIWASELDAVTRWLQASGASVDTVSLPILDLVPPVAYSILCAETSNNLARFDGIKFGCRTENSANLEELYVHTRSECFTLDTKILTLAGMYVLTKDQYGPIFNQSLKIRRDVKEKMDALLAVADFVLLPAGRKLPSVGFEEFQAAYQGLRYAALPNMIGAPSLALPVALGGAGITGVQCIGKPFDENTLLRIGKWYDKEMT